MKTKKYVRLKIGISNNKNIETKDYVLGKITKNDKEVLNNTYERLLNVIDDFCFISLERMMNKYNHK